MRVGVARERMDGEKRVALTPAGIRELRKDGHQPLVEKGAGEGCGFSDEDYVRAGARITVREEVWQKSELLCKVKEPLEYEYPLLRTGLTLFTFLHLAPNPTLVEALARAGTTAIAYETVEDARGDLPLLAPMSEIAGSLAAHAAAHFLQTPHGGSGKLIGGAPGVDAARVVVLGGGHAGFEAARVAAGMGANVTVVELSPIRIRELERFFEGRVRVLISDTDTIENEVSDADVLIGTILVSGARTPQLVTRRMLSGMQDGSVLVDVAIDQGGCAETSHPTSHQEPMFVAEGILHYCVTNMPGAVPSTSTRALMNATLPYIRRLAGLGIDEAVKGDPLLGLGVNVQGGEIVHNRVADAYEQAMSERTAVAS
jgi:alanine dehydrogenase